MQSIREIVEELLSVDPTIPLEKVRICINCEKRTTDPVVYCPRCCSMQLWPLATWLDGKQKGAA